MFSQHILNSPDGVRHMVRFDWCNIGCELYDLGFRDGHIVTCIKRGDYISVDGHEIFCDKDYSEFNLK